MGCKLRSKAAAFLADAITEAAAHAPREVKAPTIHKAEPVPANLEGRHRQLWIVRSEIDYVRDSLATARDRQDLARISSLTKVLKDLLKDEAEIESLAPRDPHAEERRWEVAKNSAVAKIKAGVNDAREKMAALLGRPFPTDADVGAG